MSFGCRYNVDTILIRDIEGLEFPCRVLAVQPGRCYRVKYLDDGNVEDHVDETDLAVPSKELLSTLPKEAPEKRVIPVAPAGEIPPGLTPAYMSGEVVDNGVTVVVHGEDDALLSPIAKKGEGKEEEKGDDVDVSAVRGGGLRALRGLRK